MDLSPEDALRINVLLASPLEAVRIDESSMTVHALSGKGEARVRLNPNRRDEAYLRAAQSLVSLRYVENDFSVAHAYPANPNGSPQGITGLSNADGRVTIMMPHPERLFRAIQHSWYPDHWDEDGPWLRLFRNARVWVR